MRTAFPTVISIKRKHVVLTGRVRSHTYDFLTLPQRWFCAKISVNHTEKRNRLVQPALTDYI